MKQRASHIPHKRWHEERRSTVRVPVDHVVAYTTGRSGPIIANVSQISSTSLRLVAGEPIAVGTTIRVAFPSGALQCKDGTQRMHVFEGRIVHKSTQFRQYSYGVDLFENLENADDLRWTILQSSLRRTAATRLRVLAKRRT